MALRSRYLALAAAAGATILVALPGIAAGSPDRSRAPGSAGSGFGQLAIEAYAAGVRQPFYSSQGEDVETEAPMADAKLSTGLQGHALTSVYWPGGTAGSGGTTLYVLTNGCIPPQPPQLPLSPPPCLVPLPAKDFSPLDDPMKAEAQSGVGKPVVRNSKGGISQVAIAKPALVSASTVVTASETKPLSESFGASYATASIRVTGPRTAVVNAKSSLHDVTIGPLKLGSVESVASAVSNTVTGNGKADTTVTNASVAGVPVTIDGSGIHVKGVHVNPKLTDTVNKALAQSGIQIFLAKPTKQIRGANVQVDAGSVIVLFQNPQYVSQANDTGQLLVLGGATITANTKRGFSYHPPKIPNPTSSPPSSGVTPSGSNGGNGGMTPPNSSGTTIPGSNPTGTAPVVASQPKGALASAVHLLSGYGAVWLMLGLAAATGIAAALKRLPDRVLERPAAACPLKERP